MLDMLPYWWTYKAGTCLEVHILRFSFMRGYPNSAEIISLESCKVAKFCSVCEAMMYYLVALMREWIEQKQIKW